MPDESFEFCEIADRLEGPEYRETTVSSVRTSSSFVVGETCGEVFATLWSDLTPVCRTSVNRVLDENLRPDGTRFHRDFFAEGIGGVSSASDTPGAGRTEGACEGSD
jgi:hypothetical protein